MERKPYPTDVSAEEWTVLAPLIPTPKSGGRPSKWRRFRVFRG